MLPSGWTPLMYATSGANVKLTQELLDRGANPNFQKGNYHFVKTGESAKWARLV